MSCAAVRNDLAGISVGGSAVKFSIFARVRGLFLISLGFVYPSLQPAQAMSLRDAVSLALISNPQIGQAIQDREALEFELKQAHGEYLPRVDFEGDVGIQKYDRQNPSSSNLFGTGLQDLFQNDEADLVVTQKIFDGYATIADIERAASRVDSTSFRVWERSENIALAIAREYIQVLLQDRIVQIADQNLAFHRNKVREITAGVKDGTLTDADQFQAEERLTAAIAKRKQAEEDLAEAKIRFFTLVGKPLEMIAPLPGLGLLPRALPQALGHAEQNNPTVAIAWADVDAADAAILKARAQYYPDVFFEGRARAGHDIDLNPGRTTDLSARLVMRWNLYDGGMKAAGEQEEIRRDSEARLKLDEIRREVEQDVRLAWDKRVREADLEKTFATQASQGAQVLSSYQDQFKVGRRSLLDVLDAQNTRFNAQVLVAASEYASLFADYQLLAASGDLLRTLNLSPPPQAQAIARAQNGVPVPAPAETDARYSPARQKMPW